MKLDVERVEDGDILDRLLPALVTDMNGGGWMRFSWIRWGDVTALDAFRVAVAVALEFGTPVVAT